MNPLRERYLQMTRRHFFGRSAAGIGTAVLASLFQNDGLVAATTGGDTASSGGLPGLPHFAAKTKRVIYLFQSGGPSQVDLYDYKPKLDNLRATELPASIRMGQRLTGMTATQTSFPVAPTIFNFERRGESGAWVSDLLPHTAKLADDLTFIKSMHTQAINHDPGGYVLPDGLPARRPAQHRRLALLRTGHAQQGSALVRRHGVERRGTQRPAAL